MDSSHRKNDPLKLMYRIAYSDLNFQLGFLKSNPFGGKLHLLGSSNGLLLCKSVSSVDEMSTYYVCNPLTAKWVSIPSPPQSKGLGVTGFFCENSSSCSSLSYFKVVHIPSFEMPSKEFNIDIFSSDLGEWISCEVSCSQYIEWNVPLINNVITHNGVVYWIEGRNRILVYDLSNNTTVGGQCSLIYLPEEEFDGFIRAPNPFHTSRSQFLGESEGLICYARISRNQRTLSVWVLEEDNWQSVHEDIELQDISAKKESRMVEGAIQVLGFSPVDRDIVLLGCKNYVWGFSMQTRRSEELSYPSFSANTHSDSGDIMLLPFVLKPMPTLLPPPF